MFRFEYCPSGKMFWLIRAIILRKHIHGNILFLIIPSSSPSTKELLVVLHCWLFLCTQNVYFYAFNAIRRKEELGRAIKIQNIKIVSNSSEG